MTLTRLADRRLIVSATLASGLFCYVLLRWYGLGPGDEAVDAAGLFWSGVFALSAVAAALKTRRPRIGRALFIAAVAVVVLMMFVVGVDRD